MKLSLYTSVLATLASITEAAPAVESRSTLPLVRSNRLRRLIKGSALVAKGQTLQDFAYAHPGRNRYIGTPGHNSTVNWLVSTLAATKFYDIEVQPFYVPDAKATLSINGISYEVAPMSFTPGGTVSGPIVLVVNLGCDAADYPVLTGKVALISRGSCTFASKTTFAKAAGAIGTIIYNNVDGVVQGTLGGEGVYAPTVGLSKADGLALAAQLPATTLTASLVVELASILTYNVIAQTKTGDKENVIMVGAHTDSVQAGPGINDNGSGTVGILENALALTEFSVNNAVRFGWWSGEEEGLLGAEHYVTTLPQAEQDKIRLYLNFDMIASPNFVYEIYDGDGSAFGISGAPGSAEAEKLWEDFFRSKEDIPTQPTAFDGRSDYGPFLDAGIAAGGLSSGADGTKTPEEVLLYGGTAGIIYDPAYHTARDTVLNCNVTAWTELTRGIGHAIATYADSFASLPPKEAKRSVEKREAYNFQRKGGKFVY